MQPRGAGATGQSNGIMGCRTRIDTAKPRKQKASLDTAKPAVGSVDFGQHGSQ
jgi:hypothetical protein